MKTNFNKNRNIIIFAIYLLFIYVGNIVAQPIISVPEPSIFLAFDRKDPAYESVSQNSGLLTGTTISVIDRFGSSDRAIRFYGRGSGIRLTGFNINVVHTVSVWLYISDPSEIPSGAQPFSPTDLKYEIYNWTDTSDRILKGIGRQKATIGFNRFIPKPGGEAVPWYLWSYKPAQFDQKGWYHIFVVHGMYYTRMIMYKPNSGKAYSYIWMGDQGFPTNKYLYVGGYDQHMPISAAFDDFKVYNAELTDDQIEALHTAEYPKNVYVRIQNQNSGKYAVVNNAEMGNLSLIIQNSTGIGNDEWILRFTGIDECKIQNLHSSRFMVVKDASTEIGAEIIQYDEKGSNNEYWILEYDFFFAKSFRLRNKESGKYLGVFQNSKEEDSKLVQLDGLENSVYWTFQNSFPNVRSEVDSGVYRLKNKKSGLYLSVLDRSTEIVAPLVQHSRFDSGDNLGFDTWYLDPAAYNRNAFTLMNSISRYYMFSWFYNPEGADITQHILRGSGEYDWQFLPTEVPDEYRLRNALKYNYAVVKDASTAENAHVIQERKGEEDNEIWKLERVYYSDSPLPRGTYKIRNENSSKMMVVKDASSEDNATIIQYGTGEENSEWELMPAYFGFVQLRNKNSKKYLVVKDSSVSNDAPLVQHGASTPNSYWRLHKEYIMESGTRRAVYTLTNARSGLYAVVSGASTEDGTPVIQYGTGEKNKLWAFERQTSNNTLTRVVEAEQESIETDLGRPEVMVDCKNDIILLDYPFKSSTELVVRIVDVTGKQVYEGKRQLDGSNNVIAISQFNSALNANQFYVISIRSADGKVNCTAKAIMSK